MNVSSLRDQKDYDMGNIELNREVNVEVTAKLKLFKERAFLCP